MLNHILTGLGVALLWALAVRACTDTETTELVPLALQGSPVDKFRIFELKGSEVPTQATIDSVVGSNWKILDFNSIPWRRTTTPMGSAKVCPTLKIFGPPTTSWSPKSNLFVRKQFDIPSGVFYRLKTVTVQWVVDDVYESLSVNGIDIPDSSVNQRSAGLPPCKAAKHLYQTEIDAKNLVIGRNVLAIHVRAWTVRTFFNVRISATSCRAPCTIQTTELVPFGVTGSPITGFHTLEVPGSAPLSDEKITSEVGADWELLAFDDSQWRHSITPIGMRLVCPELEKYGPFASEWTLGSNLFLRREFDIPSNLFDRLDRVTLEWVVDDYYESVSVNGKRIPTDEIAQRHPRSRSCPAVQHVYATEISKNDLRLGKNILALHVRDIGVQSFLNVRVAVNFCSKL